jgi:hypothetical protein
MSKLFHVRITSGGNESMNDHFNDDQLKVKYKGAYWLQAVLEMDTSAFFEYFTPDTTKDSIRAKRVQ